MGTLLSQGPGGAHPAPGGGRSMAAAWKERTVSSPRLSSCSFSVSFLPVVVTTIAPPFRGPPTPRGAAVPALRAGLREACGPRWERFACIVAWRALHASQAATPLRYRAQTRLPRFKTRGAFRVSWPGAHRVTHEAPEGRAKRARPERPPGSWGARGTGGRDGEGEDVQETKKSARKTAKTGTFVKRGPAARQERVRERVRPSNQGQITKVGPSRFELESSAPQAPRIPSYPTDPWRTAVSGVPRHRACPI